MFGELQEKLDGLFTRIKGRGRLGEEDVKAVVEAAEEKLRRRVAFSRAATEVITSFNLKPMCTFTNDAFAGIFNGLGSKDHYYVLLWEIDPLWFVPTATSCYWAPLYGLWYSSCPTNIL